MSKGSSTQTVTQKADPWKPAQPFLTGGLSDLSKYYSSGYGKDFFPGSTVVPFSPETETALGMTANRALAGSPVQTAMNTNLTDTLTGKYLDPSSNPWLSGTYDLAAGKVRAGLDSEFNKSGGLGGSLHEGAMADNLGDLATKIYGGNYDAERARQMQGMLFAPQAAASDYNDAAQLGKVGAAYEGQAGNYVSDAMNRFNFYNQSPLDRITQYLQSVGGVASGYPSSSTTSPTNSNPFSSAVGGLGAGASLLGSLGLLGSGAAAGSAGAGAATAALAVLSDRNAKKEIKDADSTKALDGIMRGAPAFDYRYRAGAGDNGTEERTGPMAQDYAKTFGGDGKTIPMPHMIGRMYAAIGELGRRVEGMSKGGGGSDPWAFAQGAA